MLVRSFVSSHGVARDLLLAISASDHTLNLSNEMLSEVARVLRYPRLIAVHGESEETIYNFTGWLRDAEAEGLIRGRLGFAVSHPVKGSRTREPL
jgi:hypothetical protein